MIILFQKLNSRLALIALLVGNFPPSAIAQVETVAANQATTSSKPDASSTKKSQIVAATPIAILPFRERGEEVEGLGTQVSDLLFANLVSESNLYLVERDELTKILEEQSLGLSGLVNPKEATKIGQLTGARLLVTGSIMQIGDSTMVVAKVIGTETSRVAGAKAKGGSDKELDEIVDMLSGKISEVIQRDTSKLLPKLVKPKDRIAAISKQLGKTKRPLLQISIKEQHIGRAVIDPAAETEFSVYAEGAGFKSLDAESTGKPEVKITGEGISEFAVRRGTLFSIRARVEIKAIDVATGKVLAIDRQTRVAVGLSEHVAAKEALQEAAADIAERMLPKLAG